MIKAVIFDVDGTLVDSVDLHAKAWQDAFRDIGHTIAFQDIRKQIGKGGDQLMPAFLSREEIDSRGQELEHRRRAVDCNCRRRRGQSYWSSLPPTLPGRQRRTGGTGASRGDQGWMTTIAYSCRNCGWTSGPMMRCLSLESCLACDSVDLVVESDLPDPPMRRPDVADIERLRLIIDVMKQRAIAMFTARRRERPARSLRA